MMRRIVSELDLSKNPLFTGDLPLSEERAQLKLKRSVNVKQDKNGAVTIIVRTRDAKLASEIVNHMLDNLSKLFLSKTDQKNRFTQKKLSETEKQLEAAEQAMLVFQTQHDITLIDDQTREVIRKLGDLDTQLIALDLQIQQTKSELANQGDLDELVKLRIQKTALEASRNVITSRIDQIRRKLSGAPQISLEYARLQRNIAMLSKTVDLLAEQYQLATVTQHGEDADYQVVDWAQVREEPVGPRNAVNGALGAACGALLASLIVISRRPKPAAREKHSSKIEHKVKNEPEAQRNPEVITEPEVIEKTPRKRKSVPKEPTLNVETPTVNEEPVVEVKPDTQATPVVKETEE
jgi:uncharacterized protein involved in exopolysaccharide biosynthesis